MSRARIRLSRNGKVHGANVYGTAGRYQHVTYCGRSRKNAWSYLRVVEKKITCQGCLRKVVASV